MTQSQAKPQAGVLPGGSNVPNGTDDAVLVLEDGRFFAGRSYGAHGTTLGEVVFNTAMTGYQEILTDSAYLRQIVVLTAPHIGNTGVNSEDTDSQKIWLSGLVVRDPARRSSNWRSEGDLVDTLLEQDIIGISGIDTRALTRHLRDHGAMRGGIFSGNALRSDGAPRMLEDLVADVRSAPSMSGADLSAIVSTSEAYTVEPAGEFAGQDPARTVVALDLGIDAETIARLTERGLRVHVVPANATFAQLQAYEPHGVFFSNSPGDPATATHPVQLLREVLAAKIPFFGIGFGNQLLGRALGFDTYKLEAGHRGANIPVMDLRTRKVEITTHNHGFAVDVPADGEVRTPHNDGQFGRVVVSHVCLNDDVVEGLECLDLPAFSVQYHPEAASGPQDAAFLFNRFLDLMTPGTESAAGLSVPTATPTTSAAKEN